jgi:hypothetical protein
MKLPFPNILLFLFFLFLPWAALWCYLFLHTSFLSRLFLLLGRITSHILANMSRGLSEKADSYSTSTAIPYFYETSKAHYNVDKNLPLDPTLAVLKLLWLTYPSSQ